MYSPILWFVMMFAVLVVNSGRPFVRADCESEESEVDLCVGSIGHPNSLPTARSLGRSMFSGRRGHGRAYGRFGRFGRDLYQDFMDLKDGHSCCTKVRVYCGALEWDRKCNVTNQIAQEVKYISNVHDECHMHGIDMTEDFCAKQSVSVDVNCQPFLGKFCGQQRTGQSVTTSGGIGSTQAAGGASHNSATVGPINSAVSQPSGGNALTQAPTSGPNHPSGGQSGVNPGPDSNHPSGGGLTTAADLTTKPSELMITKAPKKNSTCPTIQNHSYVLSISLIVLVIVAIKTNH